MRWSGNHIDIGIFEWLSIIRNQIISIYNLSKINPNIIMSFGAPWPSLKKLKGRATLSWYSPGPKRPRRVLGLACFDFLPWCAHYSFLLIFSATSFNWINFNQNKNNQFNSFENKATLVRARCQNPKFWVSECADTLPSILEFRPDSKKPCAHIGFLKYFFRSKFPENWRWDPLSSIFGQNQGFNWGKLVVWTPLRNFWPTCRSIISKTILLGRSFISYVL